MDKKKIILMTGISVVLLLVIGVSYAYWTKTFFQTDENVVVTDCFKIEFTDKNPISLSNAFPLLDENGLKTVPYTFTITNICNTSAKYQINIETLGTEGKVLPDKYLKVNLKEGESSKITTKLDKELNPKLNTETTIENALAAYKLYEGILDPNETKEYNLRMWMDEDVTPDMEDSMNASYKGKVSIITSYYQDKRGTLKATVAYQGISELVPYKANITKVIIEDEMDSKETELTFDLSASQDGSVMSYLMSNDDSETYTLYLQSDGGIKANSNSSYLFYDFSKLESIEGMENFDTSKVTNMGAMFYGCNSLTSLDVRHFDTTNVTNMWAMFYGCNSLTSLDVRHFDTSKVTNMGSMFNDCNSLTSLDVRHFDTSKVTNMGAMFNGCNSLTSLDVRHFDTSKVTYMGSMFNGCNSLTSLDVRHFDTSKVTNMGSMFNGCNSLTSLDVSHFDTSKVTNMWGMFNGCNSLTSLDVSHFDTSKVRNMWGMFNGCNSLTSLDLSSFDTSNVTNMSSMFQNCSSLTSLDLSSFDTSKVTDMIVMFNGCSNLTSLNLSSFNTTNVTNMGLMFGSCSKLTSLDLSSFDTSNVSQYASVYGMFYNCFLLTSINYGEQFVYKEGAVTGAMFYNCPANKPTHESWNGVDLSS